MALVDLLRPDVLVELGTHAGDSYCAFCQAVAELSLNTRCYAIDTWRGDEQTGHYGEEVLRDLRKHHDELYGSFSCLLQSTFSDALRQFADSEVGLLHIDGLHTLEAAKGDFESWSVKLTPNAIVLMHDTNVREREFGVWQLWRELIHRYPHFEFLHGHGLGVVALGEVPASLQPLFSASELETSEIRCFFSELGHRLAVQIELRQQVECRLKEVAALRAELAAMGAAHDRAASELRAGQEKAHGLASELREKSLGLASELRAEQQKVHELEVTAARLGEALQDITGSRAWNLVTRYRRLRDGLLPPAIGVRRAPRK
jgi:hypothetical protein